MLIPCPHDVDVGSSAVKAAVLSSPEGSGRRREGAELLSTQVERIRRRDQRQVIPRGLERAGGGDRYRPGGHRVRRHHGRGRARGVRTGHFYGMTAHARGANVPRAAARAVLDVGALHARAIAVDAGSTGATATA
jgi:benzoyl-CoA reductase subunit D